MTTVADRSITAAADAHEAAEAAHDAAAVAATFAENGVLDPKPTGTTFTGREAVTAWYEDLFTAFPDIAPELIHRHEADQVLVDEVIFRGTHDGVFNGIPATGKPVEVAATLVYEFNGANEIVRESAYWDIATMLIQMGILPAPA